MEKLYELAAEYTGNTKSNKSQGSNGMHSGVLKEFKDETVELWCVTFQLNLFSYVRTGNADMCLNMTLGKNQHSSTKRSPASQTSTGDKKPGNKIDSVDTV